MIYIIPLFYLALVALVAVSQGLCMLAIKRTPPGKEAKAQAFALHYLEVAAYFLPLVFTPTWYAVFCAVAIRFSLFDFLLNYTEKQPPFAVGNTAISDRFQQWLAVKIQLPVTLINALSKAVGLLLLLTVLIAKIY